MERTEDLLRIVEDSRCAGSNAGFPTTDESGNTVMGKPALKPSEYLNLAQRVASNIESNDALVSRMDTLSARKEFSNDPTVEMAEISDLFHMKVAIVQRDFETLKRMTEDGHHAVSDGQQQMQHYKLLMQVLNKRHLNHIESFKKALKLHSEHVQQRQKRVVKYGQGVDQVRAGVSASAGVGVGGVEKATNNYAMFSAPIGQQNLADVHRTQELRRRTGVGAEDSSGSAYVTNSENGMTNMNGHINGNMSMNMNMKASMRDYNGKPYNNNSNGSSSSSNGDRYGRGYSTQNQHQLQLQQQQRPNRDMRAHLQGAEKVEKTIAQMGQLFSKMAALVLESSETITRIEDDIEIGLSDTKEAHVSMTSFYDITKGNRSMIIKIFLLLIFFIFLFLVWT